MHPSSRPSVHPSSLSSSSASATNASSSTSRVAAKQAELDGLRQLRNYSAVLVKELEKMGEGLEGIRQGGESVSQVMSSWQTVFRGIQVAQNSVQQRTQASEANADGEDEEERLANLVPDTLVRIPVDQSYGQQQQSQQQAGSSAAAAAGGGLEDLQGDRE
ncbi:unnamed protein product [Jaminaea pallidilutea]